ncbi:MAG TPA: hypothetical protein VGK40_10740, partial [Verrucomicrobiae bacterium]
MMPEIGQNPAPRQKDSASFAVKLLECGDLSPLWPLIRLVESAEPRPSGYVFRAPVSSPSPPAEGGEGRGE